MSPNYSKLSYAERAKIHPHSLARKLLRIIDDKKSNLCLSVDVTTTAQVLEMADTLGPHICILKTHVDIISDFTPQFTSDLALLASKHKFLIFEDRKFADIGNTVKHQYQGGIYKIASWAHITNAHVVPGEGIIDGLAAVGKELDRGLLLLAEMSSSGNLATNEYTQTAVQMALSHSDFVFGFIGLRRLTDETDMITMTPGVGLESSGDNLGQVYRTPKQIVEINGSDIIIVGRGIYADKSKAVQNAIAYKEAGWNSYISRITQNNL
ncbi:hypothetical protein BB559_003968 [Furculomyces boomerangus]|uniref:Orotidine 5'-phosphate decarboxylase n=1 Tax=Furculomyces boomerangus TaxID=61424 RepID=A0A2T9YHL4_9FUNG|nr:hypothetical protein BB559_003968 [Furculomyces boomerangus]